MDNNYKRKGNWKLWVVVCVLVIGNFQSCHAQVCTTACGAGLTTCNKLNYELYVTNITTTQNIDSIVNNYALQTSPSVVGAACATFISNFLCNVMHPACNGSDPTPMLPCRSLCYDYRAACGSVAAVFPAQLKMYMNCESGIYSLENNTECSRSQSTTTTCPYTPTTFQYAGTCQDYNYGPLNLTTTRICGQYVSKKIFVPNNWPAIQLLYDALFSRIINAPLYTLPTNCLQRVSAFFCGTYFRPCTTINITQFNTTAAVGPILCKSFCEATVDACFPYFDQLNASSRLPNCTTIYASIPPMLPVGNTMQAVPCRDNIFPDDPYAPYVKPDITCPPGYGLKNNYEYTEPPCGYVCPDASYSTDEWHLLAQLTRAGGGISVFCMSFMILSYLVHFEKRKFPFSIHIYEFIATTGFAIAFLINGPNPEKNVWCNDPGTIANQTNNVACGIQGFFFIYFGLALAAWCLIISFIIFYGVILSKKIELLDRYSNRFHVFAWGVPLAFGIAALATKSIGYGPPLSWCFIHFSGFGYGGAGVSVDYPLFYIPMTILFIIVLILFICTVAKIILLQHTRMKQSNIRGPNTIIVKAQIRVFLFIIVIVAICISLLVWRFEIETAKSKEATGIAWVLCKMKVALYLVPDNSECPSDTNPARIAFSRSAGESFVLSGIGLLILIAFFDTAIFIHWAKIFTLMWERNWKQLNDLVVYGKEPKDSKESNQTQRERSKTGNSSNSHSASSVGPSGSSGSSKFKSTSRDVDIDFDSEGAVDGSLDTGGGDGVV